MATLVRWDPTSLVRWDPLTDLMAMQRDMDRLLSGAGLRPTERVGRAALVPSIDVVTRGEDLVVRAELAGVKPEDVDISVTEGMLTISGKRRDEREITEKDYVVREITYGDFERSLRLPEGVEPEHIKADYHDGVLDITLPGAAHKTAHEEYRVPIHIVEKKPIEGHH